VRLVERANEKGEITACKFDPSGQTLAACSTDKSICASWMVYGDAELMSSAVENIPTTRELWYSA